MADSVEHTSASPSMMKRILLGMLIFVPIAFILRLTNGSEGLIFLFAALGIVPLADLIGEATEELTVYTGPRLGGLLNATLGNAAELIITIFAISAGRQTLVLASITGSIIGNLLLVLGLSLLLGGLKNGIQTFDRRTASINATLLILAITALVIPSLFHTAFIDAGDVDSLNELYFNEGVAVVMIIIYALSLVYSFRTRNTTIQREAVTHESRWTLQFSIIVLVAATVTIVFMSELLVGTVEHAVETIGISELFIGIIIIPLVGNIAEHLVAVEVAIKNRMELSLAVSIGSSLQIALFVTPLLVFIGLIMQERLLLVFSSFEIIALAGTSLVTAFIANDGESNWLEGAMLLGVYVIIGIAFFFLPFAHAVPHP